MQQYWLGLKNRSPLLIFLIILVLACWVRFWHLTSLPPGFYWDEAGITYDAWGVSIDGKDQWGKSFPLVFTSFGDGKLPVTEYLLASAFHLGGFHLFWLRYITALSGVLLVVAVFFLTKKVFNKLEVAFLASFLVATSSWAIHFSRFGLEAGIGTMLMVWSVYFLYASKKVMTDLVGIGLLTLSAYSYHGNLLIAPLVLVILGWKRMRTGLFILLMLPLILALSQSSWTRAGQTVFWMTPGFELSFQHVTSEIVGRIVSHLSPSFWINGIQPNLRQAVPHFFNVYAVEIIFFAVGLWKLPKKNRFVLWLLLISILPSFIGDPAPHSIRAFNMMPFLKVIEAYGLYLIFSRSRIGGWLIFGVYLFSFGFFWRYYTTEYAMLAAPDFQYGYADMLTSLKAHETANTTFVISPIYGQPYIYTLLYWHISPPEYREGGLANVIFRPIKWPEISDTHHLYAGSPAEIPATDPRVVSKSPQWMIAR